MTFNCKKQLPDSHLFITCRKNKSSPTLLSWVELSSEKGISIYECSSKHTRWNSWEKMLLSALHVKLDRCFDYGWVDDDSFNTFTFSFSYFIHFFLSIYFLYILFLSILFLSIFFLYILFLSIFFLSIFLSIYLSFCLPLRSVNRRSFHLFPFRCLSTFPFYQFLSRSISI
jgi:hypothetical protein